MEIPNELPKFATIFGDEIKATNKIFKRQAAPAIANSSERAQSFIFSSEYKQTHAGRTKRLVRLARYHIKNAFFIWRQSCENKYVNNLKVHFN